VTTTATSVTSTLMPRVVGALVAAISIALLWAAPSIGVVAIAVCFVLLPPWGRSLAERAVISGVLILGVIALVYPRAGALALDHTTSRVTLGLTLAVAVGLQFLPSARGRTLIPRPRWTDAIVLAVTAIAAWSPIALYRGMPTDKVISGLYFSGWDNQGHFTTFANTLAAQSTTWPTPDGDIAWNQWYPSLHTTAYAVLQQATSNANLDRLAMVEPFAIWSALFFAACLGALTWVASDIARRIAPDRRSAPILAALGMGAFVSLGSVHFLFNAGFTNFLMAVTVTIAVSVIAGRSARCARRLGWFLIPLGSVAVIGLWTPLVLGLVPAGIATLIALLRWRVWAGVVWLVVVAAAGATLVVTQLQAILAGSAGVSVAEFNEQIGQVGVGMAPFDLGLAIAAPLVALVFGLLLWQRSGAGLAFSACFPAIASGLLALYFITGTDAAELARLSSYYVLKSLDASLLMAAPVTIAVLAIGASHLLARLPRPQRALASVAVGLLAVSVFGYVGVAPERLQDGFTAAPAITAAQLRLEGSGDELVGSTIVAAATAASDTPEYVPVLWDGSGQLVNLWVGSLTNTMSANQTSFYGRMPPFPYEDKDLSYLTLAQNSDPDLDLDLIWFREVSGQAIEEWARMLPPQRTITTRLLLPPSPLCPECSGT
jgi:hypothetical protein